MSRLSLTDFQNWGLEEILKAFPDLAIVPSVSNQLLVTGDLSFDARLEGFNQIIDTYSIEIRIPKAFPDQLPKVFERNGRIPESFHKFSDGSLCLGSLIRLRLLVMEHATLTGFVQRCIIPYLYGYSHFEKYGTLPQEELDHGSPGLIQDYITLLEVKDESACRGLLKLLCMKRRIANKYPCPCSSGRRVGKCHHLILNSLRTQLNRSWLRRHIQYVLQDLDSKQRRTSSSKR